MAIYIKKNNDYSKLVNFKKNKNEIIHRWFFIKEGYSKKLIFDLIDNLKISDGYIVDFFNGSGTTTLAAKEKGFKYAGFEVNPFLYLLSKVKTKDYSLEDIYEIKKTKKLIFSNYKEISNFEQVKLKISKKVFGENLEDMLKVRTLILNIKNIVVRNFFIIALVTILEDVGYSKKDGNGLKYPKNKHIKDFITCFNDSIEIMIADVLLNKYKNIKDSKIILSDSRNLNNDQVDYLKNQTSLVVFSPPYANCFDYTEVYKLELWFGNLVDEYENLKTIRNSSVSSHLNKNLEIYEEHPYLVNDLMEINKKKLWSKKIPKMINGYFFDMEKIIKKSFNILKEGGFCVIVVGNSAYSGHIIKTDEILSKIGLDVGFSEIEINIARKLRASSQQSRLFKNGSALRESVIIMKK